MSAQLAVQSHARSSEGNGLPGICLVKPSVTAIGATSVIAFFWGQIVMMGMASN